LRGRIVKPRLHAVTKVQISAANVLRCIARLRYGADSPEYRERLQRDLKRFRALSDAEISDTAVDNWFRRNTAGPQRRRSITFLHDYFSRNVTLANSATKERQNLHAAVAEFLRPPAHSNMPPRSMGSPAVGVFAKTGAVVHWNQNRDDFLQFRAIEGSYQVIRPHASGGEVFILEPMAIEVNEPQGSASLRMYSHNFRMREYVYTGDLYASFRYGFSLIRRRHEDNPGRFAIRCLNLHIGTHREAEGYVSHPCLSGLMLRGVTGSTGPIRTICTPFIALKAPPPDRDFTTAEFISMIGELRRLHTNSSIIIGEVRPPTTLFQFCSRIFSELGRDFSTGLVLQTLRPENVEKAVLSGAADANDSPFAIWSRAVNAHATAHG
jgi:hypothetical protein